MSTTWMEILLAHPEWGRKLRGRFRQERRLAWQRAHPKKKREA